MTDDPTFETAEIPSAQPSPTDGSEPFAQAVRLDRYEVKRKIAKGGFATVYEGWDPRIKRAVAIKKCHSLDEDTQERFFREAEIAGKLDHPNIVRLFDFGVFDGMPFLVQELLEGRDLADVIEAGPALSTKKRVLVLLQVARGIEYAHSHQVVHRDIKPGNVRVLDDDSVKIMDFGVATLQEAPSDLTRTGTTVGTAAYLAPEQIGGGRPNHLTDMFSFGVLAYELLSGHRPFAGETLSAVLYQIAHDKPEPLRAGVIPQRLVALVHRCLEKDPRQRLRDFGDVVAELEEALRDPRLKPAALDTEPIAVDQISAPDPLAEVPLIASDTQARPSSATLKTSRTKPRRWGKAALWAIVLGGAAAGVSLRSGADFETVLPDGVFSSLESAASGLVRTSPEASNTIETVAAKRQPERPTPEPIREAANAQTTLAGPARKQNPTSPPVQDKVATGPGTVFLPPSWHPAMTVSVDNRGYLPLDRRRVFELRPGAHVLRFSLQADGYRAHKELEIFVEPGETRTLLSPLEPPAQLRLELIPAGTPGTFEIDGKSLGQSAAEPLVLVPSEHRVVFSPGPGDPLGPLSRTFELSSAKNHVLTFDMRRRTAELHTRGTFDWQAQAPR